MSKLSYVERIHVKKAAAKKAASDKRAAEKRARYNNSKVMNNLVAERRNLEEKLNNIETKIQGFNKNIITISLGQGEIEIVVNGVTKKGNTIIAEIAAVSGFSRFKRSLKRLLKNNGLDAEKVFEMNESEINKAGKIYMELAFLKREAQKIEQKIVSVQQRINNPAKAHRKRMILESKANSFVIHFDRAHEPAPNARAERARLKKFNKGKEIFLEVYGTQSPSDLDIETTAEFADKVAQLNGAEVIETSEMKQKRRERTAFQKLVQSYNLSNYSLQALRRRAIQKAKLIVASFVRKATSFLKLEPNYQEALQALGYKRSPRTLRSFEFLASFMGHSIRFVDSVPVELVKLK